ncbi:paraquat-inducible protein A [Mucilaginibacter sp. HD30]
MPVKLKYTALNIVLLAGLSILLSGAVYCGYKLQSISAERVQVKEDYSLANSVTFGIFSIDEWSDRIANLIDGKIDAYHITPKLRGDMRKGIEAEMHGLLAKTIREIKKPQKSIGGKLKKLAFNILVDSAEIQAQVKPFANTIVAKVSSRRSEERLKDIAGSKFKQLITQTYDSTRVANYAVTQYVYKKYKVSDPESFNNAIKARVASLTEELIKYVAIMLGCVVAALLLWISMRRHVELQTPLFVFSLLFAFVLLAVGSLLPVIEVDARIQSMDLMLLGEKMTFQNQVLFYQSKSIVGIVSTLMSQRKPDTIVVGALIMLFVLVLPLLRLIAKGIYVLSTKKIARHPVVRYLTFELGKWDMADVMIVGVLMTYIGLNGIIKSQLTTLNIHTPSLNMVTDNGTSLQPGYFIFVGYVFFGALLSYVLKRVSPHDKF